MTYLGSAVWYGDPHYPPFNAESMLPFSLVKTQDSRRERIEVPTIANTSAVDHSRVQ
ncbi:hypothetical protein BHYA_0202g00020 [Botrytis hyacinthi]|uniref:Uncharacterized protein n=1 Tax=Botrytis hyacinthi TaxID=278943 RepID=A0A4Z1GBJ4_9HELO|nr:hypothetical protein BHYA_0202g00020 [Botrytis hyacinthi]